MKSYLEVFITYAKDVYLGLKDPAKNLWSIFLRKNITVKSRYLRTQKTPSKMLDRAINGTKYSRMDRVKFVEDSL